MKHYNLILIVAFSLGLVACGGGGTTPQPASDVQLLPLSGSTTQGVTARTSSGAATIAFNGLTSSRFLKVDLPSGALPQSWNWTGDTANALVLAVPSSGDLEVAVVPLAATTPVQLTLNITTGGSAPVPATPDSPSVSALAVTDNSSGKALLSWTQDIPGDYDFDGAVTLADLQALAGYWNQSVDRAQSGAAQQTAYWLDADANGTVDAGDVAAVGRNLGLQVSGYRLLRDSTELTGSGPGNALLSAGAGQIHSGLPRSFSVTADGSSSDSWEVEPVDAHGAALGAAFAGGGSLSINADISGDTLLPLDSSDAKLSTRVILPIEVNDSVSLPLPTTINGTTVSITNIPRGTVLLAQLTYKPSVAVSTGSTKVTTSVAFEIPSGVDGVAINASLALTPNSSGGGYSLALHTSTSADGGPAVDSTADLNFQTGALRRDTNSDGDLDDDFAFTDSDRDCISDPMLAELQDAGATISSQGASDISGQVQSIDLATGLFTLTGVTTHSGPALPPLLTFRAAENARLGAPPPHDSGGGGGGDDQNPPPPGGDQNPPPIRPGDQIEASIYSVTQGDGTTAYWAESLHPLGPPGAPPPSALNIMPQPDGTIQIEWQNDGSYSGYRLQRYSSPYAPDGPGDPLNACAPNVTLDWSTDLPGSASSYHDTATTPGQHYSFDLYGLDIGGNAVFLGQGVPPRKDGQGEGGR